MVSRPTCRDEILAALPAIVRASPDGTFSANDVIRALDRQGTRYAQSTIRTHVVSRMSADAPDHHARTWDDLERVSHGRYRLRGAARGRGPR
jgi:hypothetical protein